MVFSDTDRVNWHLQLSDLSMRYANTQTDVLCKLNLSVESGEFFSIIGPSGCGKSTLLKVIAGLLKPTGGQVSINGRVVRSPDTDVIMLFQDYSHSLLPWRSALGNVTFGAKSTTRELTESVELGTYYLSKVGLSHFQDYYPWQLSGGMQQRLALARALAAQPKLLLMDEPFGSLDSFSRYTLEDLTVALCQQLHITVLLVTHDIEEAIYMSDRVALLSHSPANVSEIINVPFPKLRDQINTRIDPQFIEIRSHLHREMRNRTVNTLQ